MLGKGSKGFVWAGQTMAWAGCTGMGRANTCQPDKIPFQGNASAIARKRGKVAFRSPGRVKVAKRRENVLAGSFHAIAGQRRKVKKSEEKCWRAGRGGAECSRSLKQRQAGVPAPGRVSRSIASLPCGNGGAKRETRQNG